MSPYCGYYLFSLNVFISKDHKKLLFIVSDRFTLNVVVLNAHWGSFTLLQVCMSANFSQTFTKKVGCAVLFLLC